MVSSTVKAQKGGYSVARESGITANPDKNQVIKAGSKVRSPGFPGSPQDQFRDSYDLNAPSIPEIS